MDDEKRKLIEKLEAIEDKYDKLQQLKAVFGENIGKLQETRRKAIDDFSSSCRQESFEKKPPTQVAKVAKPEEIRKKTIYRKNINLLPITWLSLFFVSFLGLLLGVEIFVIMFLASFPCSLIMTMLICEKNIILHNKNTWKLKENMKNISRPKKNISRPKKNAGNCVKNTKID